jgi:hypothetical protein
MFQHCAHIYSPMFSSTLGSGTFMSMTEDLEIRFAINVTILLNDRCSRE